MTNPPFYDSVEEYKIRRCNMKFVFKVWVLSITVDLFDLDASDSNMAFSVTVAWK